MEQVINKSKFEECYILWLKNKQSKHSKENLSKFCQIWNENLKVAENKAINEFHKKLESKE
jgi:uncharacterized protein with von Willebrand factor type A (vWA) domain